MSWTHSAWDSLPWLLILSPAIGFSLSAIAVCFERTLVRPLALSNSFCTVAIAAGLAWQLGVGAVTEATARRLPPSGEPIMTATQIAEQEALNRQVDRARVDQIARRWFNIDGLNLWAVIVLTVMTVVLIARLHPATANPAGIIPSLLLFEAASLAALTAYDLRAYLIAYPIAALCMGQMIGLWGGSARRLVASRFLIGQLCGSGLIMFGFAMLVVSVPWMKIEDAPNLPDRLWNVAQITYEIQKWTTNNQLAFQYANSELPWLMFILSLGFSIQFGLVPFQSPWISIIENSPATLSVAAVTGVSTASFLGWLRFVVPLSPELLVQFYWLILFAAFGGAIWCCLCAMTQQPLRYTLASLFMCVSSLSLLGCCTFTRPGYCGAWMLQQQLTSAMCLVLIGLDHGNNRGHSTKSPGTWRTERWMHYVILPVFLMGMFASGFVICFELLRDGLVAPAGMFVIGMTLTVIIFSMLMSGRFHRPTPEGSGLVCCASPASGAAVFFLMLIPHLFPALMIAQCEPEFARIFRRFEATPSASSARPD